MNKTHISLNFRNLDRAIAFYRDFLQAEPAKVRPGYANWDLDNPPLKLALNESAGQPGLSHLGVQVGDSESVFAAVDRLRAAGLDTRTEHGTDCCHAFQDKVWATDPDGHSWEVFVVKGDVVGNRRGGCGCAA